MPRGEPASPTLVLGNRNVQLFLSGCAIRKDAARIEIFDPTAAIDSAHIDCVMARVGVNPEEFPERPNDRRRVAEEVCGLPVLAAIQADLNRLDAIEVADGVTGKFNVAPRKPRAVLQVREAGLGPALRVIRPPLGFPIAGVVVIEK